MNFFVLFVVAFALNSDLINGLSTCDECRTKTFCLSPSGSTSCSSDVLVSAKWSADKVDNEVTGEDPVSLTLSANNVGESENRMLSFIYTSPKYPNSFTEYSCIKVGANVTAVVTQKSETRNKVYQKQGSYSSEGSLICSWSLDSYSSLWPAYYEKDADLIADNSGTFELVSGDRRAVVATNLNELPSYRLNYLSCCNKVHGNGQYLIIFNQTDDLNVNCLIRSIGHDLSNHLFTLTLKSSSGAKFIFNLNMNIHKVEGFYVNLGIRSFLEIENEFFQNSFNPVAFWSFISPDTGLYHVQFEADGKVIYSENDVSLKNEVLYELV